MQPQSGGRICIHVSIKKAILQRLGITLMNVELGYV